MRLATARLCKACWSVTLSKRMVNYTICHCMQVTRFDVEDALQKCQRFEDVEKTFQQVQAITHCSTGCGGCHDKILDTISEVMNP